MRFFLLFVRVYNIARKITSVIPAKAGIHDKEPRPAGRSFFRKGSLCEASSISWMLTCVSMTGIILCVGLSNTHAGEFSLQGQFVQGGLVYGGVSNKVEKVLFNGKELPIGENGVFAFGLNRHHPPEGALKVVYKNGETSVHAFLVQPQEYKTQAITGVAKRKVNPHPEDMKRIAADNKKIGAARSVFSQWQAFMGTFQRPLDDKAITGVYGSKRLFNGEERSWHKGVDFAAPTGTPVMAPAGGHVVLALPDSFFNGNLIILDHGHQVFSIYAHLNSMAVQKGDKVTQGQKIGEVGATGRATGPHLHWGVYWRNMALDPLLLLKKELEKPEQ